MVGDCVVAYIVMQMLIISSCNSLRCQKLSRNPNNLIEPMLTPSKNETVECTQNEVCATIWFQFGKEVIPLRQGCWSDVTGSQIKSNPKCLVKNCTPVIENLLSRGEDYCPFGPLEVCCCNRSMCNNQVKPYRPHCKIPPQISTKSSTSKPETTSTNTIVSAVIFGIVALAFGTVLVLIAKIVLQRRPSPSEELSSAEETV